MAELADAPDLGSGGAILRGSSPLPGMIRNEVCGRVSREIGAAYGPRTSWDSSTAKVVDRLLSTRMRLPRPRAEQCRRFLKLCL